MIGWRVTGMIATLIIVLSIPAYLVKSSIFTFSPELDASLAVSSFVGSLKCADCHRKEFNNWQDSHHDHAMDIANENTVLGDFNNVRFSSHDVASEFYRKDGKFFVYTQGPEGRMGEFEITHTFGWYPLQQYLIPFEGGRLQCLPIAWDVRDKRWYDLYPDGAIDPSDWLYWTNAGQNWNGMCAECHSTNLKKNYDLVKSTYQTTWTDIDVGCEACHGPGSAHVEWAEMPDMGRPVVTNYNLRVDTSNIPSRQMVEQCAPCHSRRSILGDYTHSEPDLLDGMLPSLLTPGLYYPDGQILEEVYVYGSFTQSKMYHRDVKCSDCHDVHSAKLIKEGNGLCLQCHRAGEYDTPDHHFHKSEGEEGDPIKSKEGGILFDVGTGAECIQCHMPGRDYMVIDYRPDHGFRIPRPDLTESIDTPNACNRCHADQTAKWSGEWVDKWYGPGRKAHYGETIEAGRDREPDARSDLIQLATDSLYPVIVRATALSALNRYTGIETTKVYEASLMDDEALIRRTAVADLNIQDNKEKARLIGPMLYDPVKAVRIQAASTLAGEPMEYLDSNQKKIFRRILDEFISSMEYSGDFSFGRFNLGNLYRSLKDNEKAIENYEAAIRIDNLFYPAKVNLAMMYNDLGDQDRAEALFREVHEEIPGLHEISYSLALLLAEKNNFEEAALFMGDAADNMPDVARVHYNYGILLQYLNRDMEAENEFQRALAIESENMDYLYALFDFYFKRSRRWEARELAEEMVRLNPDMPGVRELLEMVTNNSQQ